MKDLSATIGTVNSHLNKILIATDKEFSTQLKKELLSKKLSENDIHIIDIDGNIESQVSNILHHLGDAETTLVTTTNIKELPFDWAKMLESISEKMITINRNGNCVIEGKKGRKEIECTGPFSEFILETLDKGD